MSKSHIPQALRNEAARHFKGGCAYCRSPQVLMNVTFEVDHIQPEKDGGLTESANLAYSCPLCNGFKGARTRSRDPITGRTVSLFHPRRQIWSRHFRWREDKITMEGRTLCGRATIEALQLNNRNLLRLRVLWLALGSAPPDWRLPAHLRQILAEQTE